MNAGRKDQATRADDRRVDEAADESFPASDPPAYTVRRVGAPAQSPAPAPARRAAERPKEG